MRRTYQLPYWLQHWPAGHLPFPAPQVPSVEAAGLVGGGAMLSFSKVRTPDLPLSLPSAFSIGTVWQPSGLAAQSERGSVENHLA